MRYTVITIEYLTENSQWDEFVLNHTNGNYFQTFGYFSLMAQVASNKPVMLMVKSEANQVCGVLGGIISKEGTGIKGMLSSRMIIIGGPLVTENNKLIIDLLLKELIKNYNTKAIYIEFRNLFSLQDQADLFLATQFRYKSHLNYLVLLDEEKLVKKRMSESKVRQIKSSLKAGVTIQEVNEVREVNELYSILKKLYTEKVKKPLPTVDLFRNFFLMAQGKIFAVKKNQEIIGGIICPIFKHNTIYEWYVCGLDGQEKGVYPSIMATWAPMDYGLKNGIQYFDFMGAGSPDADYGVREFKEKFGGELFENGRFIRVNKPMLYQLGKWGLKLYSKIK
jgi:serine/alanine adding enzyme